MDDQDHLDQWVSAVLLAYQEGRETRDHEVSGDPGEYVVREVQLDRKVLVEYLARRVYQGPKGQ